MAQLHEILAAEKTVINARDQLTADTQNKFAKGDQYFTGFTKTLELLTDDPSNAKIEAAARQDKELPTTVLATLDYYLTYWAKAEQTLFTKNVTNTKAVADLMYNGQAIATNVPVDELMGLEVRLNELRKLFTQIPTLDASKGWAPDASAAQPGTWRATQPQVATKTEKVMTPVVLYEATDKHPAQVKEVTTDKVVGTFTINTVSGATTALQKAQALAIIDELIVETKAARTRANSVQVETVDNIGQRLADLILGPLRTSPASNQV
ncbi:hypothetical protein [Ralstonia phage phiRSL1]|uniref:Uncharacterized protein n=1 Tax=Ralstonia phage phiRSL1 TaxID=1980924 RepID=B2ZY82_9CAUD|nr:hypothetical protein RSL1_ORF270 [Ralstonia phage phiRSL1]BAG41717.1 hypothetical protein [Ralstonia phage phiRSL1]